MLARASPTPAHGSGAQPIVDAATPVHCAESADLSRCGAVGHGVVGADGPDGRAADVHSRVSTRVGWTYGLLVE